MVVTSLPGTPCTTSFSEPLSFLSSPTNLRLKGIGVSTTLSFAATFTIVSLGSFVRTGLPTEGVTLPVTLSTT